MLTFMVYQLMFTIITPVLMTGAFADRMRFKAFIVFTTLWLFLVYFPFAHWLWGGGFLAKWGVEDFAGGIVVHTSAGFGALAVVLYLGMRKHMKEGNHSPSAYSHRNRPSMVRVVWIQRRFGPEGRR